MKALSESAHILSPRRVLAGLLPALILFLQPAAADPPQLILALGDDSYIPAKAIKALTGAEVRNELGDRDLLEFAVVVFSNMPYTDLPRAVRQELPEFLNRGGSLLITGGPNSYGSGGYQAVAPLIPFEIRAKGDWVAVPFKAVISLRPNHPILAGVTFPTVGNFNDLNPKKSGETEIAQYAGGRTFDRFGNVIGARYPSPLIAEQQVGQGTVLGVAFDIGRMIRGGWTDGPRFVENLLTYLLRRSPLKPRTKESLVQTFSQWQQECDRTLREGLAGGVYWKSTAAACRRELAENRYPYMDLVDLWLAERLAIADRVRMGELSEEKGIEEVKRLKKRIESTIQDRSDPSQGAKGKGPAER